MDVLEVREDDEQYLQVLRRLERSRFRHASAECTQRGLWQAAKFASEQLASLGAPKSQPTQQQQQVEVVVEEESDKKDPVLAAMSMHTWDYGMTWTQRDMYKRALSLFNLREFGSVAYSLVDCQDNKACVFLRLYSLYFIACRTISTRRQADTHNPQRDDSSAVSEELSPIAEIYAHIEMSSAIVENDPFLLYLKGLVADKLQLTDTAISCLAQSLVLYPYNWSAWVDLTRIVKIGNEETILTQALQAMPNCLAKRLYFISSLECFSKDAILRELSDLSLTFHDSIYLSLQKASLLYSYNEYELCASIFETVFSKNPYLLDRCDEYANVLYVLNDRPKLSLLAQRCDKIDKYRPESCIVIGNYYSLRGDHTKAISYFRRAIKLNSSSSLPWTLLGHEYIELKNRHAAVEAYRCALDLCPRDFRAWFALGNVYKLIRLPYYAIYYFKRAASLRPRDPRFWVALGECYAGLDRRAEAAGCYKRALGVGGGGVAAATTPMVASLDKDSESTVRGGAAAGRGGDGGILNDVSEPERVAVVQLARLYAKEGEEGPAGHYYKLAFYHYYRGDEMHANAVESALFLARKELEAGNLSGAESIAESIIDGEDGRALMREIRSMKKE